MSDSVSSSSRRRSKYFPKSTTVFVVGAGFSNDLGYPLTFKLLKKLHMSAALKKVFIKVVKFHHPDWNGQKDAPPDIETLLTEWAANEDLLPSIRSAGKFQAEDLKRLRRQLSREIADWFHEIHEKGHPGRTSLLRRFMSMIHSSENPVIISFNWDYELDRALCEERKRREVYGLIEGRLRTPILLKPHGSLNWYSHYHGKHIKRALRETLWEDQQKPQNSRYCFLHWRAPKSTRRRYVPWIITPTHVKTFRHAMLRTIWRTCVDCLSVAKTIYFLGYSLPAADWHSRYIFRCGFHNQIKGRPVGKSGRRRASPTGRARVFIVNPRDQGAYGRIKATAGYKCTWIRLKVKDWVRQSA
jgi:hypothetical protein